MPGTEFLKQVTIFKGMDDEEISNALRNLCAEEKAFEKGERCFFAGECTEQMGLVLSGSVTVESNDLWGNRTVLNRIGKGGIFAETYSLLNNEPLLVDVVANEKSNILFLKIKGLIIKEKEPFNWENKFVKNLLSVFAHKNLHLAKRSFHTAAKSIRGRLMAYLDTVSIQKGSSDFEIPFNRQQLADYLNVERTALSKELGKMKKEGIIDVDKNHFCIKQT